AVPQPFKRFEGVAFAKALEACVGAHSSAPEQEVRNHLTTFMKSLGLPTELPPPGPTYPISAEALAEAVFARYLDWFVTEHPLRFHERLVEDPTLIDRVIDERLVDYPELAHEGAKVRDHLLKLIEDYNERPHPLRIHPLPVHPRTFEEPFVPNLL